MRRTLLGLLASTFLAAAACSSTTVIKQNAEPTADGGPEDPTADGGPTDPDAAPPTPPTDPLMVDLGTVTTGTEVTFDVPVGALGFNIVAECEPADFDQDNPFGIQRITNPAGIVVHDNFIPDGGTKETSTAAFDTIAAAAARYGKPLMVSIGVDADPAYVGWLRQRGVRLFSTGAALRATRARLSPVVTARRRADVGQTGDDPYGARRLCARRAARAAAELARGRAARAPVGGRMTTDTSHPLRHADTFLAAFVTDRRAIQDLPPRSRCASATTRRHWPRSTP